MQIRNLPALKDLDHAAGIDCLDHDLPDVCSALVRRPGRRLTPVQHVRIGQIVDARSVMCML